MPREAREPGVRERPTWKGGCAMSHPTQTLRDKVWSVLNNVWAGDSEEDLYIKTDAILDLVREALLSDEAVEAMAFHLFGTNGMAFISETKRKIVRDNITAA